MDGRDTIRESEGHESTSQEESPPKSSRATILASRIWQEISGYMERLGESFDKPVKKASPGQPRLTDERVDTAEDTETILKNSLIYVVDDEEPLLRLMTRILSRNGFNKVRTFNNGAEVLPVIFSDDGTFHDVPDLVVTDTQMPRMSGPALNERLKEIPEKNRPAVIAVSGGINTRELWGDDVTFLPKPYNHVSFPAVVRKTLLERLQAKIKK